MRASFATAAALLALLALSACGQADGEGQGEQVAAPGASARESRLLGVAAGIQRVLAAGSEDGVAAPRAVPGGFTPDAIAAEADLYRFVQVNALGLAEPARVIQDNGAEITLAFQSGVTASFDGGVLTGTRGFGDDLLTMGAPGLLAALRAGGGTLTRTMESLDAQDQIVTETFTCTVTAAGREEIDLGTRRAAAARFDENCRGEAVIFDNIYWLDGAGGILASRQYVSPTVAYLRSNRL